MLTEDKLRMTYDLPSKAEVDQFIDFLAKGKAAPIGEVRTWSGQQYVKHADGWVHVHPVTGKVTVLPTSGNVRKLDGNDEHKAHFEQYTSPKVEPEANVDHASLAEFHQTKASEAKKEYDKFRGYAKDSHQEGNFDQEDQDKKMVNKFDQEVDKHLKLADFHDTQAKLAKLPKTGDILGVKKEASGLTSLAALGSQKLKVVGTVQTGLISQPTFLKVQDEAGNTHEINPDYLESHAGSKAAPKTPDESETTNKAQGVKNKASFLSNFADSTKESANQVLMTLGHRPNRLSTHDSLKSSVKDAISLASNEELADAYEKLHGSESKYYAAKLSLVGEHLNKTQNYSADAVTDLRDALKKTGKNLGKPNEEIDQDITKAKADHLARSTRKLTDSEQNDLKGQIDKGTSNYLSLKQNFDMADSQNLGTYSHDMKVKNMSMIKDKALNDLANKIVGHSTDHRVNIKTGVQEVDSLVNRKLLKLDALKNAADKTYDNAKVKNPFDTRNPYLGLTSSGKSVFTKHLKPNSKHQVISQYDNFTTQDHRDAQKIHNDILTRAYRENGDNMNNVIYENLHRASENYHKGRI